MVVPPGGWILPQALPDGSTKKFSSMGLIWELAEQIADFRKGNGLPRATAKEAVHDIEEATCARLHQDPAHCVDPAKKKLVPASRESKSRAGRVADGARVLIEWLGDGAVPVNIALAQARANVCLGCPENKEGSRWLRLTADAVRAIAEQMQAKDAMKLRLIDEDRLHACAICACPLPLKCHVPLINILTHTDNETLRAFPQHCWIPMERQNL
jgi:predicted Fe-S protein YdhL (DUF1289 family)